MTDACWNCKGRGTYGDGADVAGCTWCGKIAGTDAAERAAYERGLRRGLAIARDYDGSGKERDVDWDAAEAQMEREIEEAKR